MGDSAVRKLPADVARCQGDQGDEGEWREGCDDCLRRTDRNVSPTTPWVKPPPIIVFECELRIAPDESAMWANRLHDDATKADRREPDL